MLLQTYRQLIASENTVDEGLLKIAKRVSEVLAQPDVNGSRQHSAFNCDADSAMPFLA